MKTWGIIGAIFFVAACVFGYVCSFDGSDIVALALSAFGVASTVIAFIKKQNENKKPLWQTIVLIAICFVAGVLVCVGGLSDNIFAEISGAVVALLTIIFGLIKAK